MFADFQGSGLMGLRVLRALLIKVGGLSGFVAATFLSNSPRAVSIDFDTLKVFSCLGLLDTLVSPGQVLVLVRGTTILEIMRK